MSETDDPRDQGFDQNETPSRVYAPVPRDYYSWTTEQRLEWIKKMIVPAIQSLRGSSPSV